MSLKEDCMKKDGFSLIELLVTIAIIGILAAIAVPGYIGQQRKADRTEAATNLDTLRLVQEQTRADSGTYSPSLGAVGVSTAIRDGNWNTIRGALPRWQPGPSQNMKFSYRIITNVQMTNPNTVPWDAATNARVPCFTAVASGVVGTRVAGDIFAVDCNNNKNY
ncbi:MAG: type II secretion system protein [Nitrospirae bacterium]|nr:MAG: type II secretion system protein [Nitrospirota bacterium]